MRHSQIPYACVALLSIQACRKGESTDIQEFRATGEHGAPGVPVSPVLEKLKASLGKATGVPVTKMSFQQEVLAGFSRDDPSSHPLNRHTEFTFQGLTRVECENLRDYFGQGFARKSEVVCRDGGMSLTDFAPPLEQALVKHRFVMQQVSHGQTDAEVLANCWSTSYEIARFRNSGKLDFAVFYADNGPMEKYFQDANFFAKAGEAKLDGSLEMLLEKGHPGDLVQFYNQGRMIHSAVLAAPGILFEKTGPSTNLTYRFVSFEDAATSWFRAERVVVLRPTSQVLPHPNAFANGSAGGNTIAAAEGRGLYLVNQIPPLEKRADGRYVLPQQAMNAASYKFEALPGRSLVDIGPIDRQVRKHCRVKTKAQVFKEPSDTSELLGELEPGFEVYARLHTSHFYAPSMLTINGKIYSPRSANAAWVDVAKLECTDEP